MDFKGNAERERRFMEPGTLIHKGRMIDYAVELCLRDNTIEGNTRRDWKERPQQHGTSVFALGRRQIEVIEEGRGGANKQQQKIK